VNETYKGIPYRFERRRYGATGTMRFFTWLHYQDTVTLEWKTYGDPWPKPRLNRAELTEALDKIFGSSLRIGDRVRLHTGMIARVESHQGDEIGVSIEALGGKVYVIPPKAINGLEAA
jgi:hypothetical protein